MKYLYTRTIKGPWITEPTTDTEWKWYIEDRILYISFQGSTSRLDWIQNLSAWKKPYKYMSRLWFAHAGFVKKWKAVEDDVISVAISGGYDSIVVSGFSQGAAIAQLCHESLVFHGFKPQTYAFASPRVFSMLGFWNVKNRLEDCHLIERHHDIVCRLPPVWMLYRKVRRPTMIDKFLPISFRFKSIHMGYKDFL